MNTETRNYRSTPTERADQQKMPIVRFTFLLLTAIVGFAATSSTIREAVSLTQYKNTDMLADRVRRVLSDPAVDTLFVGTSRTEVMVDPDRFDAAMKAGGHPTHSYVAGMLAGSVPEIEPLLRAILNARPCCLKTVILEPDFASVTPATMTASARSVHFASITNAIRMLGYINTLVEDSLSSNPAGHKDTLRSNIIYWASVRLLNIGLAHYLLDSSFTDWSLPTYSRGYSPKPYLHDPGFSDNLEVVKTFRAQVGMIVDTYRGKRSFSHLISESQWEYFVSVSQMLKNHGIQVALLHPPQYAHWSYGVAWAQGYSSRCVPGVPLFDLSDPKEYPQFFDLTYRADTDHLNSLGVPMYTDEIAKKMLAVVSHGWDKACSSAKDAQ